MQYTTLVPVRVGPPPRPSPEHEFGVCVPNGYDGPSVEALVEWLELHAMLGVAEVNLYDTDFNASLGRVFEQYRRTGMN